MGKTPSEWLVDTRHASRNKFEKFQKRYGEEFVALFNNLHKVIGLLNDGHKIGGFRVNFFRSEGDGVFRVGQTAVGNAQESRLYVYPDKENSVMFILGIGTKDEQQRDLPELKKVAKKISQKGAQ